jgi:hypothetical protein
MQGDSCLKQSMLRVAVSEQDVLDLLAILAKGTWGDMEVWVYPDGVKHPVIIKDQPLK